MSHKRSLLIFNLLYDCNNHCTFCCTDTHDVKKLIPELEFEIFQRVFREHAQHPENVIQLAGGEPLSYSKIHHVFDEIKNAKASCFLRTNGRLLSDYNFAKTLLQETPLTVIIPFTAYEPITFAQLAGDRRAYKETLKAVDNVYEIKTKYNPNLKIEITLYLCKSTEGQTEKLVEMICARWPLVDSIDVCLIRIASQVCLKNEDALRQTPDEMYQQINDTFDAIDENNFQGDITVNGLPLCFLKSHHMDRLHKSILKSEYSDVPEMFFFDGRFNRVRKKEEQHTIPDDPKTCCSDLKECIQEFENSSFENICDHCNYNGICNYRITPDKLPQNAVVQEQILFFTNSLVGQR